LSGERHPGFATPAQFFGSGFSASIAGTQITDL
jgi:hypothetical protein